MDMTAASPQSDGLRVVTPDDCTVADSTALQGFWTQAQYLKLNRPRGPEAGGRRSSAPRVGTSIARPCRVL